MSLALFSRQSTLRSTLLFALLASPRHSAPLNQDWYNPYYNSTHFALAKYLRHEIEENLMPHVDEWEEAKWMPKEVYKMWGQKGLLAFA